MFKSVCKSLSLYAHLRAKPAAPACCFFQLTSKQATGRPVHQIGNGQKRRCAEPVFT